MLPDAGHVVHLNQKEMFNFRPFLGLDPESLATVGVQRLVADSKSGFPCRVSLQDAEVGESVLLMNYQHQSGPTPYRASHAIYVREWASWATPGRKAIPDLFRCRLFSLRALDASGMMVSPSSQSDQSVSR